VMVTIVLLNDACIYAIPSTICFFVFLRVRDVCVWVAVIAI
jgi:hypothetical protein